VLSITANPEIKSGLLSVTARDVRKATANDAVSQAVRAALEAGEWPPELSRYEAFSEELVYGGDLLLRGTRFVAPAVLRLRLMKVAHLGHPGMTTMKRTLRSVVWWPGMDADIESYVKRCLGCTIMARNDPPEPMIRTVLPEEPWEYLAIDFFSPDSLGVKLLVVVDYYSRAVFAPVMHKTDAEQTCKQLENLFMTYGYPEMMRADNGPPYASKQFSDWCLRRGIELVHSVPLAPWMNGEVESQMRGIRKALTIANSLKENWRDELRNYLFGYNHRVHTVTGQKPADLLFSRKVRDLLPHLADGDIDKGPLDDSVRDRDTIAKFLSGKSMNNRRKAKSSTLAEGDLVLVENKRRKGLEARFEPTAFKVVKKLGGSVVLEGEGGKIFNRCTNQLKKVPVPLPENPVPDLLTAEETAIQSPSERTDAAVADRASVEADPARQGVVRETPEESGNQSGKNQSEKNQCVCECMALNRSAEKMRVGRTVAGKNSIQQEDRAKESWFNLRGV
jgi:transposase InsO family protein